jgi:hypothetical protein
MGSLPICWQKGSSLKHGSPRKRPLRGLTPFARKWGVTPNGLSCWKCGASLEALTLPLRRLDECKACRSELHVCRMCVDYDTRVAKHCREPTAEEVRDKTQANFCDHFKPRPGAYIAPTGEADAAKAALEALFGRK